LRHFKKGTTSGGERKVYPFRTNSKKATTFKGKLRTCSKPYHGGRKTIGEP